MNLDILKELSEDARKTLTQGPSDEQRAEQRTALIQESVQRISKKHRFSVPLLASAAMAAAVIVVLGMGLLVDRGGPEFTCWIDGRGKLGSGDWIKPRNAETTVMRFSEKSRVEILPSSRVRLAELTTEEVRVMIESGRVRSFVRSAKGRRWVFIAGPYRLLVVGTEFQVDWSADDERLTVEVTQGVVEVRGNTLDDRGMRVKGGQRLVVSRRSVEISGLTDTGTDVEESDEYVTGEPQAGSIDPQEIDVLRVEIAPRAPARPSERLPRQKNRERWKELAEANQFKAAMNEADALGFEHLLKTLNGEDLLLLADAARLSGQNRLAMDALKAARKRFAGQKASDMAVFRLGRMSFDSERFDDASKWFETYIHESPGGSMIADARGRLLDSLVKADRPAEARRAAEKYLEYDPNGRYAGLARKVLLESSGK